MRDEVQSDPRKTRWSKYFLEQNLRGGDESEIAERMKGQGGASGEKTKMAAGEQQLPQETVCHNLQLFLKSSNTEVKGQLPPSIVIALLRLFLYTFVSSKVWKVKNAFLISLLQKAEQGEIVLSEKLSVRVSIFLITRLLYSFIYTKPQCNSI